MTTSPSRLCHRLGVIHTPRRFICAQCLRSSSPGFPIAPSSPPRRWQSTATATRTSADSAIAGARAEFQRSDPIAVDPLRSLAAELKSLTKNIQKLVGSGDFALDRIAKYYTQGEGKYVRPTLVLLMSQATSTSSKSPHLPPSLQQSTIDAPLTPALLLADSNPSAPGPPKRRSFSPLTDPPPPAPAAPGILPAQRRLAEITELIHTASLLHDDVIDTSAARRGGASANVAFGNKMAVLAGDFLLGRASVALARLRDPEVIELLATVIANLVEGEFMQLRNTAEEGGEGQAGSDWVGARAGGGGGEVAPAASATPSWSEDALAYYLHKTYLKSASLISKSCRGAALLGRCGDDVVDAAYAYGKNLGLAFQLVDDILDYTVGADELGKPAGADLQLGLATAPLLFAWRGCAEVGGLVGRKFEGRGDVRRAREIVALSDGVEQTRALAQEYANRAMDAIRGFPESEAKAGLLEMCHRVMRRRK